MKFRLSAGAIVPLALLLASSAVAQQDSKDTKDQQTPSIQQTAPDQKLRNSCGSGKPFGKTHFKKESSGPLCPDAVRPNGKARAGYGFQG